MVAVNEAQSLQSERIWIWEKEKEEKEKKKKRKVRRRENPPSTSVGSNFEAALEWWFEAMDSILAWPSELSQKNPKKHPKAERHEQSENRWNVEHSIEPWLTVQREQIFGSRLLQGISLRHLFPPNNHKPPQCSSHLRDSRFLLFCISLRMGIQLDSYLSKWDEQEVACNVQEHPHLRSRNSQSSNQLGICSPLHQQGSHHLVFRFRFRFLFLAKREKKDFVCVIFSRKLVVLTLSLVGFFFSAILLPWSSWWFLIATSFRVAATRVITIVIIFEEWLEFATSPRSDSF